MEKKRVKIISKATTFKEGNKLYDYILYTNNNVFYMNIFSTK